jgi:hypothetical protein
MNQYLDAAIKAARAAGALVRENFGRPLKVNVEEAHDIQVELDVRSQALITDYQGTHARQSIPSRQSSTISRASQQRVLLPVGSYHLIWSSQDVIGLFSNNKSRLLFPLRFRRRESGSSEVDEKRRRKRAP